MTAPTPRREPAPDEPANGDRVVIRDKRRIDPVTGEVREQAAATEPPAHPHPAAESVELAALQEAVAERTADLQRLQAEYANYRKRAERERLAAGDVAVSRVLTELLPVLDDIDRARQHGDLTGALKSVADHLESIFGKLGLQSFGAVGDPFDPAIHEAVLHAESDDVTESTCTTVMRPGYKHNDRLLRAAMVGVTDPSAPMSADAMVAETDELGGDSEARVDDE
ncbi:MAG TPA: nucleotide exchange factor GrpE [Jatrophihabitantaceae bacterium]|nr:nucleotide exchange factor GrpE [Jatrophihabitantaceae bacterium]